ncbi:DDE-type integrase/transposase/recombinase [Pseudaminobacter sp. 19-2017]|uniref:DDE-type integrase/transposase/recombinase n=1 Tax=Pseudaminobacter soli (ex Zhang et al. 2022) TaxID=2831468 RepID=A0A942E267_9HYPH|nr:Mu transposase C-terminal domain-containing protein [Pseudaminobacter soli]MBS3652081.1 DDE-type integrase/transposase/recombinase [Pseudaminobacter soli]
MARGVKPIDPAGVVRRERSHKFGRHDRLVIDGQSFRADRKVKDTHVLQPVTGDLIAEDYFITKTDGEINALIGAKRMRIDEGYYSKAIGILRVGFDNSDLSDLSDEEHRTVAWKKEWCVRFLNAAAYPENSWRPCRTIPDCTRFVTENRDRMDRWFLDKFGVRRRPGRRLRGEVRKAFDYPSGATLKVWLRLFIAGHCRMESLSPHYSNCGNRNQLDPRAAEVIAIEAQKFASTLKPKMADICQNIESVLDKKNKKLPEHQQIYASDNAVRRRIHLLDPFMVDAGRKGTDYALRKYTPVGMGLRVTTALGRVEMDDWEVDLHTLIEKSSVWKRLKPKHRKLVPRVRLTLTGAIDCASRCIPGLNLSVNSPSTATAKPALRSIMVDKTELATAAGAKASWHMHGRPGEVATDAGPEFGNEFDDAATHVNITHTTPEQDPRKRGTIEAFFRTFKRLCRYFAGRAFANVVEKGDYPAEELAALTVGEFYRAVIVFIVDYYHLRPHRGLEGRTPYNKWLELEKEGLPPAPSDEQLAIAFGLPRKQRSISKHGIEFIGISYNSNELSGLYKLNGSKKVDIIVEPEDLGYVFVKIPKQFRGRIKGVPEDRHYLKVHSVGGIGQGKSLATVLLAKKAVRDLVKKEAEAGRLIRIEAHRRFLDLAEDVRKRAGIPTHEITAKTLDLIEHRVDFSARAAFGSIDYGTEERAERGTLGSVVSRSTRRRVESNQQSPPSPISQDGEAEAKPKPFGGSMNLDDGEDQ